MKILRPVLGLAAATTLALAGLTAPAVARQATTQPVEPVGPLHTTSLRISLTCPADNNYALVAVTVHQDGQVRATEANHQYGDCTGHRQVVRVPLSPAYDYYEGTPPPLVPGVADVEFFAVAGTGPFGTDENGGFGPVDLSSTVQGARVVR